MSAPARLVGAAGEQPGHRDGLTKRYHKILAHVMFHGESRVVLDRHVGGQGAETVAHEIRLVEGTESSIYVVSLLCFPRCGRELLQRGCTARAHVKPTADPGVAIAAIVA